MIKFSTTLIDLVLLSFFLIYPISIFFGLYIIRNMMCCLLIVTTIIVLFDKGKITFYYFVRILIIFIGIGFFTLEGILNGFYISSISEVRAILMLVTLPIAFILLDENNFLNVAKTRKAIIWMFFIYIALELLLMLTYFDIPIPVFLVNTMQNSYELVKHATSLDEGFGGIFPRFNFASDCYIPIIYFLYAWKKNRGLFLWGLILVLELLTFSRFRLAEFLVISLLLCLKKIFVSAYDLKKILQTVFAGCIIFFLISQIDFNLIFDILDNRYFGGDATGSDKIRAFQFSQLWAYFLDNCLLGVGIGGYVSGYVAHRSLWLYELGFLMLLMQFGIVGFVFVYLNYLHMVICATIKKVDRDMKFPLYLSFLFWAVEAGIQGGIIEGENCGVLFCCIYVLVHK